MYGRAAVTAHMSSNHAGAVVMFVVDGAEKSGVKPAAASRAPAAATVCPSSVPLQFTVLSGSSTVSILSGTHPYFVWRCWNAASMNSAYSAGV